MQSIEDLNKQLPKGIKATLVNNEMHFVVRTSFKGKKYSLGTFLSLDAAIRALAEFKIKQTYAVAAKDIADIVSSTLAEQQVKIKSKIKDTQKQTPLATDVDLLREYIDMNGPHLLGSGNEAIHITLEDGTIKHVNKEVVAIIYTEIWGMAPANSINQIVEI